MDGKKTLLIGVVATIVGIILCWWARCLVWKLIAGAVALGLLVAGILFLVMGYMEAKEDREAAAKELAESTKQEAETAKE